MIELLTGPDLRAALEGQMRTARMYGAVKYAYVIPTTKVVGLRFPLAVGDSIESIYFTRAPEYEATHIRITAFLVAMSAPLEPLVLLLRETEDCLGHRTITQHESLRPQVQAIFRRTDQKDRGAHGVVQHETSPRASDEPPTP